MTCKTVMIIAGSDSGCGAGIHADLKTLNHLSVTAHAVMTAITAQNNQKISDIHYLPEQIIANQMHALTANDCVVKIGMLGSVEAISAVQKYLSHHHYPAILDPVLMSSSHHPLFTGSIELYRHELITLLPHVTLFMPNKLEVEAVLQRKINDNNDIISAADEFIGMGVKNILIKGGHFPGVFCQDYFANGSESYWISSQRNQSQDCRGTGCVLASAAAAALAQGHGIKDALVLAKMYINRALRHASVTGQLHHQYDWPDNANDLPCVSLHPDISKIPAFNSDDQEKMGLYPIVDSVNMLQKILSSGVNHIQLRIKHLTGMQLEDEIKSAIKIARQYQIKLFINDYWQLAVKHGAYGVHLGQEDLLDADVALIHASGLRLGISTHSYFELARAHSYHPSYIAFGPIYHTDSKVMSFGPQGLEKLSRWRRLVQSPLVAIGGIHAENIDDVAATNVDGVAMISAVTRTTDPLQAAIQLMQKVTASAA